ICGVPGPPFSRRQPTLPRRPTAAGGAGAGGSRGERPGARYRPRRHRPTHARRRCRRRAEPSRAERDRTGRDGTGREIPPQVSAVPGRTWRDRAGRYRRPPVTGTAVGVIWGGLAWEKPSLGMGSAREPEGLQVLSRQAGAEDGCEPSASCPGCPATGECLPGSGCAAGARAMRTCCVPEAESHGTKASSVAEKKVPSPAGPAPGPLLQDTSTEQSVAVATGSCGGPSGAAPACGPTAMGVPNTQKEDAAPTSPVPNPCLQATSKDMGSTPALAKHVAFVEPTANTGTAELPSQEQPQDSKGTSLVAAPQIKSSEAPKHPQGGTADPPSTSTVGTGGRSEAGPSSTALDQGKAERSSSRDVGAGSNQQPPTAKQLCESYSFEVTPPQDAGTQDMGTQVDNRVSLVSVALSPMSPPCGAAAFTFPKREMASAVPRLEPSKKDAEMQVSMPVETRSVATGPMTPVAKSPQTSYPEVQVKGTVPEVVEEEPPEPIREVSWDEKGMTWEVYGASMEVEVLGMAIQKHLEKQIEEHGRQVVVTPQTTRTGSVKGGPRTGEAKRQPSVFRALLQNVRRPRCCSRAGPAME
ncbi:GRIN1 protein, partial [Erithacus rubecula]|nr:GRIN1 protein [Erithacus rubecula]